MMKLRRFVSIIIILLVIAAGSWFGANHFLVRGKQEELEVWTDGKFIYSEGLSQVSKFYSGDNREKAESEARKRAIWDAEERLFEAYLERDLPTTKNITVKSWALEWKCNPFCHYDKSEVDVNTGEADNKEVIKTSKLEEERFKAVIKVPIA